MSPGAHQRFLLLLLLQAHLNSGKPKPSSLHRDLTANEKVSVFKSSLKEKSMNILVCSVPGHRGSRFCPSFVRRFMKTVSVRI